MNKYSILEQYLGKKDKKSGASLSIIQHLQDVYVVGKYVWNYILNSEIRSNIECKFKYAREVFLFSCLTHDLGKFSIDFQNDILGITGKNKNHVLITSYLIEYLLRVSSGDFFKSVTNEIVVMHHGFSTGCGSKKSIFDYELEQDGNLSILENLSKSNYINDVLEEVGINKNNIEDSILFKYNKIDWSVRIILSGLLILSDWLGSNTEIFPYRIYKDREKYALEKLDKIFLKYRIRNFVDCAEFYKNVFNFEPNSVQKEVYENVNLDKQKLFIIEAPTGIGKTEAALSIAYRICNREKGERGIYIAMPTRATSNALYERFNEFLNRIIEKSDNGINNEQLVSLQHSQSKLFLKNINKTNKDKLEQIYNSEKEEIERTNAKRFLKYKLSAMNPFVLGTMDYVLYICKRIKHFTMLHTTMLNHVFIFDEVHSYDVIALECLKKSLKILSAYNIPVIILSATLPNNIRKEIEESYCRGEADKCYYINGYNYNFNQKKQVKIDFSLYKENQKNNREDIYNIINKIKEFGNKGIYGIIVNTVYRAERIYQELVESNFCSQEDITLLHSRFVNTDRTTIEKYIINNICGKNVNKRKEFHIVISTQIMEQSIDVDFDCMFSEICPIDALIQRIGRLHRHSKNNTGRTAFLKEPICFVLKPVSEYKGSSPYLPYSDYIINMTHDVLLNKLENNNYIIDTNKDTRELVNSVYDIDECDNLYLKSLKEKFNELYNNYIGKTKNKQKEAENFQLEIVSNFNKNFNLFNFEPKNSEVEVRDTLLTMEVSILLRKNNNEGGYSYYTLQDIENEIDFDKEDYLDILKEQSIVLPNRLIKKITYEGLLEEFSEKDENKKINNNSSTTMIFDYDEYLENDKKRTGNYIISGKDYENRSHVMNIYYDRALGLVIEEIFK